MCMICAQTRPFDPDCPYSNRPGVTYTEIFDAPASIFTPYYILPGDTFLGAVAFFGDVDWVGVTLEQGKTYTISLTGFGLPGTALANPILGLHDNLGTFLTFDDDSGPGLNSELTVTATRSGVYYLVAGASFSSGMGYYELKVEGEAPPRDPPTVGTLDEMATYLTDGSHEWFGFNGGVRRHFDRAQGDTISVDLSTLENDGRFLARVALAEWAAVTGLGFVEMMGGADITFVDNQSGAAANMVVTNGFIDTATINISRQWLIDEGNSIDSYGYQTYLHEIGHALGLGHMGPYNFNAQWDADNIYLNDSWQFTVMSYFNQDRNLHLSASYATLLTPMLVDLVAIHDLYGTPTGLRGGDTTYGFNSTAGGVLDLWMALPGPLAVTIFDQGGHDTLDLGGITVAQRIDLRQGRFSDVAGLIGNLAIARGTVIEDAIGGSGADVITGNAAANRLRGGAGNDTLHGLDGNDTLSGGPGDDLLFGGHGADLLFGGLGDDTLRGGTGNDRLEGGPGNDQLFGERGNDTLIGGDGADTLDGGPGNDRLFGGNGPDLLRGGDGNDTLDGGSGNDRLFGGPGNDLLRGGDGADRLFGGDGADTLEGGNGADTLEGGAGNDILRGGPGNDLLYGGGGRDILQGGTGDDRLYGGAERDTLYGGDGNDTLSGDGGADLIFGGTGDDLIFGGDGSDTLFGGSGNDTIWGGADDDMIGGGAGNDLIHGGPGNDTLQGDAGSDTLRGGAGNDRLFGGDGNDFLFGGDGDDWLYGGTGADVMSGGAGADVFVWRDVAEVGLGATRDQVTDFETGLDRLDLSALTLIWLGTGGFTGTGREARLFTGGGNGFLQIDISGDRTVDAALILTGVLALDVGDLIL